LVQVRWSWPRRCRRFGLCLRCGSRCRALAFIIDAIGKNRAVLVVVHFVDVGFVPVFDRFEVFEELVAGIGVGFFEGPGAVGFESRAGEFRKRFGVKEAVAGAVDGDVSVAGMDVVEDGFFGCGVDALDVGVDEKGVVAVQILRVRSARRSV